MRFSVKRIVFQAILAATYTALTVAVAPIAYGPLQFRVSEALTILPFFDPFCAIGLGIGCFFANLIGGYGVLDMVFGTLASVIAAIWTSKIKREWLAPMPPVLVNAVIIGAVLAYTITPESFGSSYPLFAAEVLVGQLGACYVLGLPLLKLIKKYNLKGRFGL